MSILDILNRVGQVINSKENQDIAEALGVSPQVCTNWKNPKRRKEGTDYIPIQELIIFAKKHEITLDWLLTGEKPKTANILAEGEGKIDIWQYKALFESQQKQIDFLSEAVLGSKRTHEKIWDSINKINEALNNKDESLNKIRDTLNILRCMIDELIKVGIAAGENKNMSEFTHLKSIRDTGKRRRTDVA